MSSTSESKGGIRPMSADRMANLRLEYEKTQEMAIHYDRLNWNIGYILIAGVYVGIGLVGDKIYLYPALIIISLVTLGIWRLFYERHKAIQRIKWKRLQEIEKELGLDQHLSVDREDHSGGKRIGGLTGDRLAWILTLGIPFVLLVVYISHLILIPRFPNGLQFP